MSRYVTPSSAVVPAAPAARPNNAALRTRLTTPAYPSRAGASEIGARSGPPRVAVVELEFNGELWFWRGPSPFHFVTTPVRQAAEIEAVSDRVTYGWGMIPVTARIGSTTWSTSLWPKDDSYLVPVKAAVRRAEDLEIGDLVTVRLTVAL